MRARHRKGVAGWQKATAVIPLALLAGAWSTTLGSVGSSTATADTDAGDPGIPAVPATTFDQPASYTRPPTLTSPQQPEQSALDDPSHASASGIPAAALAAYRRSEAVLEQADPECRLSWALVAAIGRVESDHGRYGGNVLGSDGVARPGVYGVRLDGSQGTATITDTDGGRLDRDPSWDRAVGPMQFIPSTWAMVGVDGDSDGERNPQDIDDAALAAAVYLCAGEHDLSTSVGQRAAVRAYNHSDAYVSLVLQVMRSYLDGDYTEVPDGLPTVTFVPVRQPVEPARPDDRDGRDEGREHNVQQRHDRPERGATDQQQPAAEPDRGGTPDGPDPARDDDEPTDQSPEVPTSPTTSTPDPVEQAQETVEEAEETVEEAEETVEEVEETVVETLGLSEATARCRDKLEGSLLVTESMIQSCGAQLAGKTAEEASQLLSGTVPEVIARLGL